MKKIDEMSEMEIREFVRKYEENKVKVREWGKKWREENKEKVSEMGKRYREKRKMMIEECKRRGLVK